MSDKNSQNPLAGKAKPLDSAASKPEDAHKSLPETNPGATVTPTAVAANPVIPPEGVVQDDNKPSNDHGQADPENSEISEYDESLKQSASANLGISVAAEADEDAGVVARYTSYPIQKYRVGKDFVFDKGVLTLRSQEAADKFAEVLENLPEIERSRIKKLDLAGAREISKKVQASQPGATKTTDSSVGDRGLKPKVGTGELGKNGQTGEVK